MSAADVAAPGPSSTPIAVAVSGPAEDAVRTHVPALVAEHVASRLFSQDPTLWGPDAEDESSKRLSWVGLAESSRPLVATVESLRADLLAEGLTRVVLCGMGGSSLAPEVITATAGVDLVTLDGTDPQQVERAVSTDLASTVVVVSSKSGSTLETDSQRRAFVGAFEAAGIDAASRLVVVTDPGSALGDLAREGGYRAVVEADPGVGGRYSALTAFGLVPSGLAGVDLTALLDEAASAAAVIDADGPENPALVLGAALGGTAGRTKVAIVDGGGSSGSGLTGFGDWAEQLIAESTGKLGTGVLPVVVADGDLEVTDTPVDVLLAHLVADAGAAPLSGGAAQVAVSGPLGAQMLLWEAAVAVAGRVLGINPFDQPDVESAKVAARQMLDGDGASAGGDEPDLVDGGIEVRATPGLLDGVQDAPGALAALLATLAQPTEGSDGAEGTDGGYLAVMAYLDREAHAPLAAARASLARATRRPVTFGWAPRFLHSTGQYHKGGHPTGVFLQITAEAGQDLGIPGRDFTFASLIAAQAAGDASVLADHDRPVLRLHLRDRGAAMDQLTALMED